MSHEPPVVPDRVASHPHPEPRSYPMMLRTWDYAWWRPVVGVIALPAAVMLIAPFVLLPVLAVAVMVSGGDFDAKFNDALTLKSVTPAAMLYVNLTLASAIVFAALLMRVLHHLRPRWLMSVLPGVRWRFLGVCAGLALVALVAQVLVSMVLPQDAANDIGGATNPVDKQFVILAIVLLLTTPLQAMGEEYAFRGYLMQCFGSLARSPWVAIVVTSVLFALAHGVQNFPLFFDRFAFGLLAGFLVVRTGGLEAGIALHVLNNWIAFGFAMVWGDMTSALTATEASWWNVPLTITQSGLYLVLVLFAARRMGIGARTTPLRTQLARPAPVLPPQRPSV